jgi:ribosomal protein S18 acetylase RimI-like enzyme
MALASVGYRRIDETIVLVADIASRVPATTYSATSDGGVIIDITSAPDLAWCDGIAEANGVPTALRSAHDRMLAALRLPAAFAVLRTGITPISYGLAVVERGMVGLFDIVTVPDARRRGYGRCLVEALLAWGMVQGASGAYLQVVATNMPALTLYDQLGFCETYRYHYRMR